MTESPIAWTILTATTIILFFCIYLPIKYVQRQKSKPLHTEQTSPHTPITKVPKDSTQSDVPAQPADLILLQNRILLYPLLVDLISELMEAHAECVTIPFMIDTLLDYSGEERQIILTDTLHQIDSFGIYAIPILAEIQLYGQKNHIHCSKQLRYRMEQILAIAPFATNPRTCEEHYLYFLNLLLPPEDQPTPKYHPALFWTICRLIHHLFEYTLLQLASQLRKEIEAILDEQNSYQPELFEEIDPNVLDIEVLIWQIGKQLK